MTCPSCGAPADPDSRFCSRCGTPLGSPEGTAPEPAAGAASGASVPGWLTTDWPLAVVVVLAFLAIAAGAGAVLGFIPAAIANGIGPESLVGAVAGAWLPFSGVGADTGVIVTADDGLAFWSMGGLVLTVTIGLFALATALHRAALPRVSPARDYTLAFVTKVALLGAAGIGIAGAVLSIGDVQDGPDGDGFQVVSSVGVGEGFWWTLLLLGAAGLWAARDRLPRPAVLDRLGWLAPIRYGAACWVVMVFVLGVAAGTVAVAKGDDNTERIAGVVVAPVVVPNAGVATSAFAVGASNDTTTESGDIDPIDPRLDEHVSLFHWGVPPDDDSDAAPFYLWPLLAVAPLLAFLATRAHLRRRRAHDAGAILGGAVAVAVGFALAAWLGAVFAPLSAAGGALEFDGFDVTSRGIALHPSVGATFGLTLVWALLGALVSAFVWASAHRVDLIGSLSSATPPQPPSAPGPPGG